MTKYISTQPPLGANGKFLRGKAAERARRERQSCRPRQKCRVCEGTHKMMRKIGDLVFPLECVHCDEDGYAKVVCDDCGEVLPMCKCMRESGYAAAVPS